MRFKWRSSVAHHKKTRHGVASGVKNKCSRRRREGLTRKTSQQGREFEEDAEDDIAWIGMRVGIDFSAQGKSSSSTEDSQSLQDKEAGGLCSESSCVLGLSDCVAGEDYVPDPSWSKLFFSDAVDQSIPAETCESRDQRLIRGDITETTSSPEYEEVAWTEPKLCRLRWEDPLRSFLGSSSPLPFLL